MDHHVDDSDTVPLPFRPVKLPCSGIQLGNRLVKAAMYEHLSRILGGPPNQYHYDLYSQWAEHDWGMIITGNVQVSSRHLTLGRDLVVPSRLTDENLAPFRKLSGCMKGKVCILQLNHSGRQSSNLIGGRLPFEPPLAPSAVRVTGKSEGFMSEVFHSLLFQTPQSMTLDDIDSVVDDFLRGAELALKTGFAGVQLHMAHGYLLSQFLSAKTNRRTDDYSCAMADNALRLVYRIVSGIRGLAPTTFILSVKFSTENTEPHEETRALGYIEKIAGWGLLDFIEISGGDYTNPEFMTSMSPTSGRQALFASFSREVTQLLSSMPSPVPLVMLTGGLRTPALCHSVLDNHEADLVGIGRGAIICPNLPDLLRRRTRADEGSLPFGQEPKRQSGFVGSVLQLLPRISLVGAGTNMAWYLVKMRTLAERNTSWEPSYGISAILHMWFWFRAPELRLPASATIGWLPLIIVCMVVLYVTL